MIATWPADLPLPNREGYQAGVVDPRSRKSAETGPPGWRRRWSSVARAVSLSIDLTRSQKAAFDDFYEATTRFGVLPFDMADPVTDGWPLLTGDGGPVLDGDGAPLLIAARWICLFGAEPPVETLTRALTFRISFSIWVMP